MRIVARPLAEGAEQWGARAKQEPEIIPVATVGDIIERIFSPAAEGMDDQDDPGGQAVPESQEQVLPPCHELAPFQRRVCWVQPAAPARPLVPLASTKYAPQARRLHAIIGYPLVLVLVLVLRWRSSA
jgi:hypothetical protein